MSIHNHQIIKDTSSDVGRIEMLFGNAGVKIIEPSTEGLIRLTKLQAIKLAELINKKYKVKDL